MKEQIGSVGHFVDARTYISNVLITEMHHLDAGEVSKDQFMYLVDALERQSFTEDHPKFFRCIRELAFKEAE
jgi:hypothetical protein